MRFFDRHVDRILAASMVILLALATGMAACGSHKAPTGLTPQATTAFYSSQVIRALDQVRDVADAAHHTAPPLIDAQTELKIVNWHQAAIKVANDAQVGWQTALLTGLDGLEVNLPGPQRLVVAPYLSLVRTLIATLAPPPPGGEL